MLVLGRTDSDTALAIATDLLLTVRRTESAKHFRCTISLGVSTARPSGDDYEDLIQQADSALYQAKKAGKNQVLRYVSSPL